ncbi:MAG: four helix bundle protein [Bacteroidetes bacterium]|nr:MAG: four helix bundle protein [Bacteroidota bacterium]
MATIKRFEDLEVLRKARELDNIIYKLSKKERLSKDFDLKRQALRSSGSIMDNIAEGFERGGKGEFVQFLSISKGSAGELRSQIYRSSDREYLSAEEFANVNARCEEISKMLQGFMDYLQNSTIKGSKYLKE